MKNIYLSKKILLKFMVAVPLVFLVVFACKDGSVNENSEDTDYLQVPDHFPTLQFPEENPYSNAKFELGRMLFYEPLLTKNLEMKSCSNCHKQSNSFADHYAQSKNFLLEPQARNVMSLTNVVYRDKLHWDGGAGNSSHIEHGIYHDLFLIQFFASDTNRIAERLMNHPVYPEMFRKAFGKDAEPSAFLVAKAIATFVRCFISGNSPYDKYIQGDSDAMSEFAIRGMELFFSERTRCSVCHSGLFFSDMDFHNTGVNTHYFDFGRFYVTDNYDDFGKFLTPTLRNVEVSEPYTHDGELYTLEEVLENYNKGGSPFQSKDTLIRPLNLTIQEKVDIIRFLKSLTDQDFLNDERFKDPHN